ncbi:MAG: tRNA uridine-5-carboxymethylaminomethyl(34) synthesis GTPase MnmE [Candidatus Azosocius agrarius]|nr:MAG: tRNA uridine-5-carboxymethylaminomethyl(34) synthesis GTPase MnmE [Gammaproteobacteria bacterium]
MKLLTDTIVSLSTPYGQGGISIIKISGKKVFFLMDKILQQKIYSRIVDYCYFYDLNGDVVDKGIVIFFKAPNSFTGEDVLEFHCHGGIVIVNVLLKIVLSLGIRLASPGEFTLRAFLKNKLDLIQAEAISQLIFSKTEASLEAALKSLNGLFSGHIRLLLNDVSMLRIYVETSIDFSENNINLLKKEEFIYDISRLLKNFDIIIKNSQDTKNISYGVNIVIFGNANSGKSTLMNLLSKEEVSIVDKFPGTTRDIIKSFIIIGGIKFNLIDTAGIRMTNNFVEIEGIKRSINIAIKSDLLLLVIDFSKHDKLDINVIYDDLFYFINFNKINYIILLNKCDLLNKNLYNNFKYYNNFIFFSAKTGYGLNKLKKLILKKFNYINNDNAIFFVNNRHLNNINISKNHIKNCINYLKYDYMYDILSEELRLAQENLMEIIGEGVEESFLDIIFSKFCIGK